MEFLKAISPGWVGSLIGLIGVIGLVITFLLYRASRVGPRPIYQYRALRLIGREKQALPEEVTVLFRDKKVKRLTKTYIILWNSGKATVNGENIVADDPLRLEFSKDGEVLSARVLSFTRQSNKFTANINPRSPNQVICGFDYLDAQDGAVLELLHTAEERYPMVRGSIRGIPKGLSGWGSIAPSPKRTFIFVFFSSMLMIAYALWQSLTSEPSLSTWVILAFGLFYFFMALSILWIGRRRFPKSLWIQDFEW